MKNLLLPLFNFRKNPTVRNDQAAQRGSSSCTKISLHLLVNQMLARLQPLAMKRGNVILNGTPNGLSFVMEENKLVTALWQLISGALTSRKNECIHIITLVADDSTTVCVKNSVQSADMSFRIPNALLAFDC